jgi:hypothetical protein
MQETGGTIVVNLFLLLASGLLLLELVTRTGFEPVDASVKGW